MRDLVICSLLILFNIKLCILFVSCNYSEKKSNDVVLTDKHSTYNKEFSNDNRHQALTVEQLSSFFPNQFRGIKKTQVKLNKELDAVMIIYGIRQYEITIIDDIISNYSNVHSFYKKYRKLDSTQMIKSVRDGYKTITERTLSNDTTSISFVFKKRYLISIKGFGNKTPYMVWRFLELNKLHMLPD